MEEAKSLEPHGKTSRPEPAWEIALSFRAEDEGLAQQLADLLGDRYRVFLYSREQERLTGPDGEERLMEIFEQARAVAVLYRPGWAEGGWTYAEEIAIRKRGRERRFEDFLYVVNVDGQASDLPWLPTNLIWWDLPRFGVEGAAVAISSFAQRAGLEGRSETAAERAARFERKRMWEAEKRSFLRSPDGIALVRSEMDELFGLLESQTRELSTKHRSLSLQVQRWLDRTVNIWGHERTLSVSREEDFYSLEGNSGFYVRLYEGYSAENITRARKPTLLRDMQFDVDLLPPRRLRWCAEGGACLPTAELADFLIKLLIEEIDAAQG